MSETVGNTDDQGAGRRARLTVLGALAGLILIMAGGIWGAQSFIESERAREVQAWQVRLGIIADSRMAAVRGWLDGQFGVMTGLAENASLQIYLTELALLAAAETGAAGTPVPEAEFLENLLLVTAQQGGFLADAPTRVVPANISQAGQAGIALTTADGSQVLAATPDMPPISGRFRAAMDEAADKGAPVLIDVFEAPAGPSIGFVVPIYGIQDDATTAANLGFVVGQKRIGEDLYGALVQPGDISDTGETLLVRRDGNVLVYLSPLADGTPPFKRKLAMDTPDLAAAFALRSPGGFAELRDYEGDAVLATGRAVTGAPWVVVRKIDGAEALAATDSRLTTLLYVFVSIIVIIGVAVIAVWKYSTSVRTARAMGQMSVALERFTNFSKFLTVVTDGHPAMIGAVSAETRYTFANRWVADAAGIEKSEVLGKTMAGMIGPVKAREIERINKDVFRMLDGAPPDRKFEAVEHVLTFEEAEGRRSIIQGNFLPLRGDRDFPPAVLHILQDITEAVEEREKRWRTMRKLVDTLVSLVDRRDPHSANQSQRVAEVAREVATEMGGDPDMVRTADLTGTLMNLGKVLVPPELLTKAGRLTDEEAAQVRESMLAGADLLENLEFDVPVAEAMRDLQEKWDGDGYPAGKKGEHIHPAARVVAVANAFVGMVSPRSYRDAIPFDKAMDILREGIERSYDRRPVTALANLLDNRGGRDRWAHFMRRPEDLTDG